MERRKSQYFRVVSGRVQEVRETVCELFYSRPRWPSLITASLLALGFLAGGGPSTLITDLSHWYLACRSSYLFLVNGLEVEEPNQPPNFSHSDFFFNSLTLLFTQSTSLWLRTVLEVVKRKICGKTTFWRALTKHMAYLHLQMLNSSLLSGQIKSFLKRHRHSSAIKLVFSK